MRSEIKITELKSSNLEGGYLIDGFPSVGHTSTVAAESMIHTSQYELVGIIDSDDFPPVSLVNNETPNYPTRVFVNNDLKIAVFSSFLTLHESLHRIMAKTMLDWAKKQKISLIVSSVPIKTTDEDADKITAAGSTDAARAKLREVGITVLKHGTIPGIPGMLLNEGMINNQNVIVVLYQSKGKEPDFRSSTQLCMAISMLIPGASCDISLLQKQAELAEESFKKAEEETRRMKDSMYR